MLRIFLVVETPLRFYVSSAGDAIDIRSCGEIGGGALFSFGPPARSSKSKVTAAARALLSEQCDVTHRKASGGALFSFGPPARSSRSTVTAAARALLSEQCDVTQTEIFWRGAFFFWTAGALFFFWTARAQQQQVDS